GIQLGEYDRSLPVTIDPVLVYSTHLGGTTGQDQDGNTFPANTGIKGIGLDSHRNVYVAGSTSATDFPTTAGAFDRAPNMQPEFHVGSFTNSGFVSKFDPTGRILIYSTFLRVEVDAMTVDPAGHVYSAEAIADEDLEPNPGFDRGMHIDKLSLDGSKLAFTRAFADTSCQAFGDSFPRALAADNSGHVWLVGFTQSPCFPVTSGAFQKSLPNPNESGFVTKFDTNQAPSASVVFSTYMGSSGSGSEVDAVAIDSSANACLAGGTFGSTFPHSATFGTGDNSVYVAKLNAAGSGLVFGTLLHGGFQVGGIAIDSSHNVYVAGMAFTGFHTTTGAFRTSLTGTNCRDINGNATPCPQGFVTKLSPGGGTLLYSTFLGGSSNNSGSVGGLSLNSAGMAFVAGSTNSADFPTTANGFKRTLPAGATNAYVEVLQPSGNSLYYSTLLGGSHSTFGGPIFVDPAWNAWVAGNTSDTDYPVTSDAFQPGLKGNSDGFFAKVVIAADLRVTLAENTTLIARNSNVTYTERVTNFGPDGSDA
ncbi:MAG TPA: SBBP repeat-containing protein, partial [Alphaproteobacteria bacterium]|nr:SBBP repeat-containing protein [Alphaproteobacteria bacterium]